MDDAHTSVECLEENMGVATRHLENTNELIARLLMFKHSLEADFEEVTEVYNIRKQELMNQLDRLYAELNQCTEDDDTSGIEAEIAHIEAEISRLDECYMRTRQSYEELIELNDTVKSRCDDTVEILEDGIAYLVEKKDTVHMYGSIPFIKSMEEYDHSSRMSNSGLKSTGQSWHRNSSGNMVFDSPMETSCSLNSNQGKSFGKYGYGGSCALASSQNVLNMAGIKITEKELLDYVTNTRSPNHPGETLAQNYGKYGHMGGVYGDDIPTILNHYGVESEYRKCRVIERDIRTNEISNALGQGRGVIALVNPKTFWPSEGTENRGKHSYDNGNHAITVISTEVDRFGKAVGFYVCDSGTGGEDSCRFVSYDKMRSSLIGTVITKNIIR